MASRMRVGSGKANHAILQEQYTNAKNARKSQKILCSRLTNEPTDAPWTKYTPDADQNPTKHPTTTMTPKTPYGRMDKVGC